MQSHRPPQRNTPQSPQKRPLTEIKTFKKTSTSQDYENALKVFLEGKKKGVSTGFPRLDDLTGGFLPGQSYLLYADTNVGKSVFAVNMIVDMAKRGVKCLYFDLENSMEMTMERLMFVAADGKVNLTNWRAAVEEKNTEEIIKSMSTLKDILGDIYIWDLNKLNERFGEILWEGVSRCIEEGVEQGVQVVIIDHLHYFAPSETDHSVLGEISRQLNNMCAIHNISILLVAHTRKGLTHADRTGKVTASRPTLDFINGSGMISKHFKNIVALKRNVVAVDPAERCETSVYVDKTKYGPSGYFQLRYDENTLRFIDEDVPRTIDAFEKKQEETDKAKTEKDRLVDLFMSPSEEDGAEDDDEITAEEILEKFD